VEKKPEQDIPIVVLEITDWDVVSGDRNDPVFWDRTEEIGLGRDDAGVQKVLRKWWAGEYVRASEGFIISCSPELMGQILFRPIATPRLSPSGGGRWPVQTSSKFCFTQANEWSNHP
jgi:hypothetical protein